MSISNLTIAQLREILARGVSEHCAAVHAAAGDGTANPGGGLAFRGIGSSGAVPEPGDEEQSSIIVQLADSMRESGFLATRPIELVGEQGEERISDGFHRTSAAILLVNAGVWSEEQEVPCITIPASEAWARVWANTLHRNLSRGERAALADEIRKKMGLTEKEAAERFGIHRRDLAIIRTMSTDVGGRLLLSLCREYGLGPRNAERANAAGLNVALTRTEENPERGLMRRIPVDIPAGKPRTRGGKPAARDPRWAVVKEIDRLGRVRLEAGAIKMLKGWGITDRTPFAKRIEAVKRAARRKVKEIDRPDIAGILQEAAAIIDGLEAAIKEKVAPGTGEGPAPKPTPEFFGEEDPDPLTDVWPGLKHHLSRRLETCRLVRCERILVREDVRECVFHAPDVYLANPVHTDEPNFGFSGDRRGLRLVADELNLGLSDQQLEAILQRKTPPEIEERRAAVRHCSTDAERLLAAVTEPLLLLHHGLPDSLLDVLDGGGSRGRLPGIALAKAAIATWHTDALKQYKWALDRLDPPLKWAGSAPAVRFVQSLGFSAEWAGERNRKRDPFELVEGPLSLPALHDYQRFIADSVRDLLRGECGNGAGQRGMISMPTGSGKTRVAVQAIVEAMREDGFRGGVLWVADRDELCEQAVEAWRQVWSSEGAQAARLRISRMWSGQPPPLPTNELHVVVATIQTLDARLSKQPDEYEFLADFKLVVFDEAHRSIAPTFTSVMQDIGLTRFQRADEPFLLGLTATPYRGHDVEEMARLARRYGSRRLDSGAFMSNDTQAVIRELQGMGVLAQADHETIEGETLSAETFSARELRQASTLPWLPRSVENRIARSSMRTRHIIEAYETHIQPDWPALIFATSVEHARTVAALLNQKGIRARAVSGETEPATRRRVVEEFRCGEIRALVNYGVFREGFDAPRTRAIIVARPVYSPNLYFQMIGRGLRGPANGGDERCLILDVRDNIKSFDRALAFSELDWLWA